MGILDPPKSEKTPTAAKRRSGIHDLPSLGPLKKEGTVGFLNYRETDVTPSRRKSKGKKKSLDAMESDDSDEDVEIVGKMDDVEETKHDPNHLSVEDAERAGQVSEGIRKMKVRDLSTDVCFDEATGRRLRVLNHRHGLRYFQLKRQHSAEPLAQNGSLSADGMRKSSRGNSGTASPSAGAGSGSPAVKAEDSKPPNGTATGGTMFGSSVGDVKKEDDFQVGSPFKRQRSSMADVDNSVKDRLASSGLTNASNSIAEIVGGTSGSTAQGDTTGAKHNPEPAAFPGITFGGSLFKKDDNDEEL